MWGRTSRLSGRARLWGHAGAGVQQGEVGSFHRHHAPEPHGTTKYVYNSNQFREAALPFETLSKAPIREALIGIRVQASNTDLGALERALQQLPDDYQTKREQVTLAQTQLNFESGGPQSASFDKRQLGWRFGTKSGRYAVQARTDWFIFSHLAPYTTWPEFTREAQTVWRTLSEIYAPTSVQLLSVRNINEVKLDKGEYVEKYLKFYINVPEGVPQGFKNYFARIELQYADDTTAVLQSGLLSAQPGSVQLLLDIELVKTVAPKNENELWALIHALHEPKNQIFFSCITKEWEAKLK